jgi:hypothetical protein
MVGQIVQWPSSLLRLSTHSYFLQANSRQGVPDLAGRVQIISTGDQIWSLQMNLALDGDPVRIRQFETYVDQMEGMANIAEIGVKDCLGYDETIAPMQQPFSTGEYFSTGYGFLGDGVQPLVATATAAIGAKSITVATTDPIITPLREGDKFSHDYFLYRVTGWNNGVVSFLPALRSAVAVDDVLSTTPPTVRMRFASDGEGRSTRTIHNHRAPVTLNFIEVFDR